MSTKNFPRVKVFSQVFFKKLAGFGAEPHKTPNTNKLKNKTTPARKCERVLLYKFYQPIAEFPELFFPRSVQESQIRSNFLPFEVKKSIVVSFSSVMYA